MVEAGLDTVPGEWCVLLGRWRATWHKPKQPIMSSSSTVSGFTIAHTTSRLFKSPSTRFSAPTFPSSQLSPSVSDSLWPVLSTFHVDNNTPSRYKPKITMAPSSDSVLLPSGDNIFDVAPELAAELHSFRATVNAKQLVLPWAVLVSQEILWAPCKCGLYLLEFNSLTPSFALFSCRWVDRADFDFDRAWPVTGDRIFKHFHQFADIPKDVRHKIVCTLNFFLRGQESCPHVMPRYWAPVWLGFSRTFSNSN